jgi:hypothetical protein
LPSLNEAEKILVRFALQIDRANRVTGTPRRRSNKFKTERFEAKINLRVHQAAGMNGEESHLLDPLFHRAMFGVCAYFVNPALAGGVEPGGSGLPTFQPASPMPATATIMLKMISEQTSSEC